MNFSLRWSDEARRNLLQIISFIQRDSEQRTYEFGQKVIRDVGRLKTFPFSGRIVPELSDFQPAPLEMFVGEYRIIYRFIRQHAEIVTIVHMHRHLPFFLEKLV